MTITDTEPNTQYDTATTDSAPPEEVVVDGDPGMDTAPATQPEASLPAAPVSDPRIERMEQELAAMRDREREYLALLGRQQPQQQAQPEMPMGEYAKQYFGENSAAGIAKIMEEMERRLSRRFADRNDVDQIRGATTHLVANTVEQQAIEELRGMKVPESEIRIIHAEAQKEAREQARNGIAIPPQMAKYIYKAKLAERQAAQGVTTADAAAAAKARVAARAQKAGTPAVPAPSGNAKIELSDDELNVSFKELLKNPKLAGKTA